MQSSLQSLLGGLSYAPALMIWQPRLFILLMGGSLLVFGASVCMYGLYLYYRHNKEGGMSPVRLNLNRAIRQCLLGPRTGLRLNSRCQRQLDHCSQWHCFRHVLCGPYNDARFRTCCYL